MHQYDQVDEDNPLQPIMVSWYRSIFVPENREELEADLRKIQTYCRRIDLGLQGKVAHLLDFLMQRMKAKLLSMRDGNCTTAQHMELLPPPKASGVLSIGEEEFIRRVSCGEIRLHELIAKIQGSGASGSSSGSSGASKARKH